MRTDFRFTIGRKIYVIIALSLAGFVGLTWFATSQLERALIQQRRQELKHIVEMAVGVVKEEYDRAQKAGTPLEQAAGRAAERIGVLRFDGTEYLFITDAKNITVMHASAAMIGKDMSDVKDPTGKRFVVEMGEVARRDGGGYVDYVWPKPGFDKPQPKLSYAAAFGPFGWMLGTGVYIDDLHQQVWDATRGALVVAGAMLLVIGAFSITIALRTSKAMRGMTAAMRELAEGKLDIVLPGLGRRDEVGEIAEAVEAFKAKAVEKAQGEAHEREMRARSDADARRSAEEREAAQKRAAEEKAAAERKAAMNDLANRFETAVGHVVTTVTTTATQLESAAGTLNQTAATTQRLSGSVATASGQASANVQSVASATEELTSSVQEISRQVHESSKIAGEAVKQAEKTDARIAQLSQAAARIGDVVKLITAIAEQTNLLALNATIEAARAGEAGKGFAVVAQEVKALAAHTAKATEEIGSQITGMQTATGESVAAIKEIGATIARVAQIAESIAAAVEEQGAATHEISTNVQQAAKGTAEVAGNITAVNRGAEETGAASSQVLASAKSLARESGVLTQELAKFLDTVRAA